MASKDYTVVVIVGAACIAISAVTFLLNRPGAQDERAQKRLSPEETAELERRITQQGSYTKPEAKVVFVGMTRSDVVHAWGEPKARSKTVTATGVSELWRYTKRSLIFQDGRLIAINTED